MRKKKVLIHTTPCKLKTGFGRNAKALMRHLYATGKYEIVEYGAGGKWNPDPWAMKMPWKFYGTIPPDPEWKSIQANKGYSNMVHYGCKYIDEVIRLEKPDVYIGIEDIWAFNGYWNKVWWKNINVVLHTTLDSLPILPAAIEAAKKTQNFYVWANFAEREMNRLGFPNVKRIYGCFDEGNFRKLSQIEKMEVREKNGIQPGAFIVGSVFRNQLRKSVPQLLAGFKMFMEKAPNAYLLLHTRWKEEGGNSWDIKRLMKENGVPDEKVLTTYVCSACGEYMVTPYREEGHDCKFCGHKKSVFTTTPHSGVSETQLNEIYNLFDVGAFCFTSGGLEIPVYESKLTETITLVTNYSCGEDGCSPESGGLPLAWEPYYVPESLFIKATTLPTSIRDQLIKVYEMSPDERARMGRKARDFTLKNFSNEKIGKRWEEIVDSLPYIVDKEGYNEPEWAGVPHKVWDFDFTEPFKNPGYEPPNEPDNVKWLQDIYRNVLLLELSEEDSGLQYWLGVLKQKGEAARPGVLQYFRNQAQKENDERNSRVPFDSLLDKEDAGKRIAIVMPESAGDVLMVTSLFESIKELYPDHNLYFVTKPQFFEIVEGNPNIHKVLPYGDFCDSLFWMEGAGTKKGLFEVCYLPHVGTQRHLDFLHNGKDILGLELNKV